MREYLTFIAWCRSRNDMRIGRPEVERAAQLVNLEDRLDHRIKSLSGGMVRRLGIAQALLGTSDLLLLDEPTVGLDPIQRQDLRELLVALGDSMAVVVSTHLSEDVAAVADRVLILSQGQSVFDGEVVELCGVAGDGSATGTNGDAGFLALSAEAVKRGR